MQGVGCCAQVVNLHAMRLPAKHPTTRSLLPNRAPQANEVAAGLHEQLAAQVQRIRELEVRRCVCCIHVLLASSGPAELFDDNSAVALSRYTQSLLCPHPALQAEREGATERMQVPRAGRLSCRP